MERESRYVGLKRHARVHTFRFLTIVLAWLLLIAAFYQKPELLTGLQRSIQHGLEAIGDTIPSPWGPRIEIVLREIGGIIWLQVTVVVVALRVVLSVIAFGWRAVMKRI